MTERRRRLLREEFAVRIAVGVLILVFNELFAVAAETQVVVRTTAVIAILLNGPYYLAMRTERWGREQAYVRMSLDVMFITVGLYAAGGLAAAQYVGVYSIVPVYTAIVFSSRASVLATVLATVSFLAVATVQHLGLLRMTRLPMPDAWEIAGFNLLVLNIVGGLAATLAAAYRKSRHRLAALYEELERAHDESLRLNEHIQRASRIHVLSEVVAGVTHEMRNVLQSAFGHLWMARRLLVESPAEAIQHLNKVEYSCESAMRIIRTTLDMARPQQERRERVGIAAVVARVAELKAYDLRRDRIALRIDLHEGLPPISGTSFQLQQVLLNLVTNAQDELHHVEGRREIVITGIAEPDRCVVEVRDTGRGIPMSALPHLFEPFYTTKSTGTGLGLAISAGIVEGFGGTLTAANHREGGAAFRLTLPSAR
ncbi:MAG TPA: ATP-binding protein [Methylomirabilota bacterium]|nr:ATP-binding protein [Methylomirabilota bacterium]